jgi:PAS domain S-box-containing protein
MPLWQANAISVLLFMATVASIILVGLAASASKRERARPFAVLQAAVFVWCFFAYLQFRVDSFGERFAYLQYGYLGVLVLPCAAFAFGRALDKRPLSLVQVLLLGLFPLVTAFFVLDPANTGLFWRAGQGTEALAVRLGPWFWLDVLYSYVLITLLVVSVLRSYRRSAGLARRWLRHSMSLFLLPGLASLYFLVSLLLSARPGFPFGLLSGLADHGLAPLDPTPIVFGLTGVFVALALGRFNMLDSIPFSKEQVFDAMSDPIITIDDEGRIIGSNRNAGALFASSLPLEGLLLAGLCPATAGLLGGGEGHWLAAGRAYDIVVRPVAMRRGRLRGGGVVIFYDVTERVRAQGELGEREEALRRYAFIANASRESMSIVNRDLRFEAVNDAFCEGYGRSREEVVGACVTDLWQDNAGLGDILGGYETCLRGEAAVARLSHDFGDGRGGRDLELSFYPYRSTTGEVTHAVLVSKDVTDYLETQRELSSARERADASNEAKGSFLASMSHEIRTPLNAIIGLTELSLREEHTGGMAAELRDNLETVRGAAHGLLELINDILDLS